MSRMSWRLARRCRCHRSRRLRAGQADETCSYVVREGKPSQWRGDPHPDNREILDKNPFGNREREQRWGHGIQKPVDCMRRPIENNSGHGGRRIWYGLELDPAYVYDYVAGCDGNFGSIRNVGLRCG
jgi:hypothetical protein